MWERCRSAAASAWAQCTWAEAAGTVGDLGTFLPILLGLVSVVGLDLGTTLIVTGRTASCLQLQLASKRRPQAFTLTVLQQL